MGLVNGLPMLRTKWLTGLALGGAALYAVRHRIRARTRMDFQGKAIVITGGSRGLGLVLGRQLAAKGARLALLARDPAELESAARELRDKGVADVLTYACDVGEREAICAALADVEKRFGRIDVLINNAGVIQVGPFEHMEIEDYERALRAHFWGPLYAMQAVIPGMTARGGGRIVNISSFGGKVAVPHLAPYSASKFALVGLSDALRAELRSRGILVTTVCPGLMLTGSHVNAQFKGKHEAEYAWFAIGSSLGSVDVERAAARVLDACRYGDPHLTIGLSARLIMIADALAPSLVGRILAAVNQGLPKASDSVSGNTAKPGWKSRSPVSSSIFTRRADRAAAPHHEAPPENADGFRDSF